MPAKPASDLSHSSAQPDAVHSVATEPSPLSSLATLSKGDQARIHTIVAAVTEAQISLRERLEELGFLPGETVRVVATAFPSGDPIAVRIGNTTFALRRHEADMILVERNG